MTTSNTPAAAPTLRSAQAAADIAALEHRRRELETKRAECAAHLTTAQRARSTAYAENAPRAEIERLTREIGNFTEHVDGYTGGIAAVDEKLAAARQRHATATIAEATERMSAAVAQRKAALTAMHDAIVAFVRTTLEPALRGIDAANSEANTHWLARAEARRRAGLLPESADSGPFDRQWTTFPDLRDITHLLTQYADGEMPQQRAFAEAERSFAMRKSMNEARIAEQQGRVAAPVVAH